MPAEWIKNLTDFRKTGLGAAVNRGMNRKTFFLLIAVCGLAIGWLRVPGAADQSKRLIGQTARVGIEDASLDFIARVDTGAASTSVHAESVRVQGDMVDFVLVNHDGSRVPMRMPVARTGTVRNSEGGKKRVFVEMTLSHEGQSKRVLVNLNDRSGLTYRLLLGRNWLKDDYMVDVSQQLDERIPGRDGSTRELQSLASSE
jgi:hypothetical protein